MTDENQTQPAPEQMPPKQTIPEQESQSVTVNSLNNTQELAAAVAGADNASLPGQDAAEPEPEKTDEMKAVDYALRKIADRVKEDPANGKVRHALTHLNAAYSWLSKEVLSK